MPSNRLRCGCLAACIMVSAILAGSFASARESRLITIDDLVTLREPARLRLSPDGQYATYVVTQALLASNEFVAELFLVPTDARHPPQCLAKLTRDRHALDSRWAPDSGHIAFVRQGESGFEIWTREVTNGREQRSVAGLSNVTLQRWHPNGSALVYSVQSEIAMDASPVRVFDPAVRYSGQRVMSPRAWTQSTPVRAETQYWQVDLANRQTTRLTREQIQELLPQTPRHQYPQVKPWANPSSHGETVSPDGHWLAFITRFVQAETQSSPPVYRARAVSLRPVRQIDEPRHLLQSETLALDESPIWTPDSRSILILQRTPTTSSVYDISVPAGQVRTRFRTSDGLSDWAWDARRKTFVAVAQRPTSPPAIVRVELASGRQTVLHRPNAHFDQIELPPEPRYLHVVTRFGHRHGVRVTLPNDYRRGRSYPLVATTYISGNTFQRGGVGDEFPIYAYAAHGFVVASFDDAPDVLASSETGNLEASGIRTRSALDALEKVVLQLVDEGIVDKSRCGITGLSFGSEIVGRALLDSELFSVAAATTGGVVWDPFTWVLLDEQWRTQRLPLRGLRFPDVEGMGVWQKVSPALNADRIRMPLLLQPPDSEALGSLHLYQSLQRFDVPVDMYAYPNEEHIKSAPWSKYWVYRRNLDWMRFWLQNQEDADPLTAEQYVRWRELRKRWQHRAPTP